MSVVYCGVCPHPPIAVPEVGHAEADKVLATRQALLEMGRRVLQSAAETVVMISPHAPVFRDVVAINRAPELKGDLGGFGAREVQFSLAGDQAMADEIIKQAEVLGLDAVNLSPEIQRQYNLSPRLDHGVTVPLYFLQKAGVDLPLVHVSMAVAPVGKLYLFGLAVRQAANVLNRKVALLASGDLSHGLTRQAPGGYLPRGREFDEQLVRLLGAPDIAGVLQMDPELVEQAGECGYRSIVMMLGALDGYEVQAEILSYEGPFGVGYLVASLAPGRADGAPSLYAGMQAARRQEMAQRREKESYLVKYARETLERHVKGEPPPEVADVPEEFRKKAGVFVSLKKQGRLRGCIGTIEPVQPDIVAEVAANAISAGLYDPRFQPVRREELEDLEYSVDVLRPPEPISGLNELDPEKYGVIVRAGRRSGLLLPNLEGVDTVAEQVAIARQKAGIGPDEPVRLERFEVIRYK